MKDLLFGTAALALVAFAVPASAQTTTPGSDPLVAPGGTPTVASACNETDLARVQDMVSEAPENVQAQLDQRLAMARDFQTDEDYQRCAQELAAIERIVQDQSAGTTGTTGNMGTVGTTGTAGTAGTAGTVGVTGATGAVGTTADTVGTGAGIEPEADTEAVVAECNEVSMAQVQSIIDEAPENLQTQLDEKLMQARDAQTDQDLYRCAQTLAEIRQIVEGGTGATQ